MEAEAHHHSGHDVGFGYFMLGAVALLDDSLGHNDRRRRRNGAEPDYDSFDDDEVSPIPESVDGEDSARR